MTSLANRDYPDEYRNDASQTYKTYVPTKSFSLPMDFGGVSFLYYTADANIEAGKATFNFNVKSNYTGTQKDLSLHCIIRTKNWYGTSSEEIQLDSFYVSIKSNYSGNVSFTNRSYLQTKQYVSVYIFAGDWRESAYTYLEITPGNCTFDNVLMRDIEVEVSPSELQPGQKLNITVINKRDVPVDWEITSSGLRYDNGVAEMNPFSIACQESWLGDKNELGMRIHVKSRAITNGVAPGFRLYRSPITLTCASDNVYIGTEQTITINDPYSRPLRITTTIRVAAPGGGYYLYDYRVDDDIKNSYTITVSEEFFKQNNVSENSVIVYVEARDSFRRKATISYGVFRSALEMEIEAETDPSTTPPTIYCVTGDTFRLNFQGRDNRELTVWIRSSDGRILYLLDNIYQMVVNSDTVELNCYARWFDDADVINGTTFTAIVYAQDEYYRTATAKIEIRAGTDTFPSVTTTYIKEQPEEFPQTLASYYIQGYTKLGFSVNAHPTTKAAINRVYVRLYSDSSFTKQVNQIELTLNEETGKYEGTTQNALTQTVYRRTYVVDQRRTAYWQNTNPISVIPYSVPQISNVHYHRCDSDGSANDGGEYLHLEATYNFSPITVSGVSKNTKDTNLHFSGYNPPPDVTQDPQSYSETITYLIGDADNKFSQDHAYDITISATDLLNSTVRTYTLSTAGVIMDFLAGGKGIGLGKVAEYSKMVEVNPEWKLQAKYIDVYVNGQYQDLTTILERLLGN